MPSFYEYEFTAYYTGELREYFDQFYTDGMSTVDLIEAGRPILFDFDYPMFDSEYRSNFETMFIRQFFFREIGFDTFGIFKFRLENWLNLHMPYYNKMYLTVQWEDEYNPMNNVHHTETTTRTVTKNNSIEVLSNKSADGSHDETRSGTTNSQNFERDLESNTPDTRLTISSSDDDDPTVGIIEYASQIDERRNLGKTEVSSEDTNTAHSEEHVDGTTTVTGTDTETIDKTSSGKVGVESYSKLMKDYRQNLMNIDQMIYKEMNQLFMLLY